MYRRYRVTIGNPHFSDTDSSYQVRKYVHSAYEYAQKMLEENPNRSIRITDTEIRKVVFLVERGERLIDELADVVTSTPAARRSRSWYRNLLKSPQISREETNILYAVETFNRRTGKATRKFELPQNAYSYALNLESESGFIFVEIKYGSEVVYESNYDASSRRILVHTDRLSSAA